LKVKFFTNGPFVSNDKFFAETFGVQIRVEGDRGPQPGVGKFTAGEREGLERPWIIGDVPAIDANGLPVEEIGQCGVGAGWVAQGAGGDKEATDKVIAQFSFDAEAYADTGPVAVLKPRSILVKAFTTYPDVTGEAEASNQAFERGEFSSAHLGC
jgi:hypothetical protein